MIDMATGIELALLAAAIGLLLWLVRLATQKADESLAPRLDALDKSHERSERAIREEIARTRDELSKGARDQRQELTDALKGFGDSSGQRLAEASASQAAQLTSFAERLASFEKTNAERLDAIRNESTTAAKGLREEIVGTLGKITESNTKTMAELSAAQMNQLTTMSATIDKLSTSIEAKLEALRLTTETQLKNMQADNARQIDQMRQTVDEKLQSTLEKRLGESFKQVSERLEQVHKGLGEMQTLATGVGDLKKVLTNVKTRGTWGETQLGALLEQVLTPEQFERNVATKQTNERVEFAIRLPGPGGDRDERVWLPIDAKFPLEDYQRLLDAQERVDPEAVEAAGRQLEARVRACANDIAEKYLSPPATTDFGILFLPIEGLFAEVIRRPGLADDIQLHKRVVIAGPTTLWSILNSLQMGFRTLAIQERSSEVWKLLSAVKTEWSKYGEALQAVQTKLTQASSAIEKVHTRSRAVGRKLRDVHEMPLGEAAAVLPASELAELEDEESSD